MKSFAKKRKFLETEALGKRIRLDIGCGTGNWSYQASQYGAKSVDGFNHRLYRLRNHKIYTIYYDDLTNKGNGGISKISYFTIPYSQHSIREYNEYAIIIIMMIHLMLL